MNYIYDITLNLKKELYNFYEWRETDYPIFVLKIPIFKIDNDAFLDLKNNYVKISNNILRLINNKTEIYSSNSIKNKKYTCLFACLEEVIALEFDENGITINKSSLLIDEEEDVLDMVNLLKYTVLDYKVCKLNKQKEILNTRYEKELISKVEIELKKIIKNKNYDGLKYIYYEIYNKKNDNIDKIYIKLLNIIKKCDYRIIKIKELIEIMNKKMIIN